MGVKIYKVGGAVRDQLMGAHTNDIDYAVEASCYAEMRDYILTQGGTIWQEREQYQTIRAKMPDMGDADFVLCRKDGFYYDGRRPDTVEVGTILDDLARRDFTMNAIAQDMTTGALLDPFHGVWDINNHQLRCVGNPYSRFYEDPLRMLRAIRFSITKKLAIMPETEACLFDATLIHRMDTVSIDRLMAELLRCFKADSYSTLQALHTYDELTHRLFVLHPKLWLHPTIKG